MREGLVLRRGASAEIDQRVTSNGGFRRFELQPSCSLERPWKYTYGGFGILTRGRISPGDRAAARQPDASCAKVMVNCQLPRSVRCGRRPGRDWPGPPSMLAALGQSGKDHRTSVAATMRPMMLHGSGWSSDWRAPRVAAAPYLPAPVSTVGGAAQSGGRRFQLRSGDPRLRELRAHRPSRYALFGVDL
jgi:hypothetical protein